MTDLTAQAAANIAAGGRDGPGTDVCRGCGGAKEPTRKNSARCRACGAKGARTTQPVRAAKKTVRADLPPEVWDRLAVEAASHNMPIGRWLVTLIVKRDTKLHGASN